jgi:hypothetical protein
MQFKRSTVTILPLIILLLFVASCSTVKNYQPNKPFIFANKINIEGDIAKDEKKD